MDLPRYLLGGALLPSMSMCAWGWAFNLRLEEVFAELDANRDGMALALAKPEIESRRFDTN